MDFYAIIVIMEGRVSYLIGTVSPLELIDQRDQARVFMNPCEARRMRAQVSLMYAGAVVEVIVL